MGFTTSSLTSTSVSAPPSKTTRSASGSVKLKLLPLSSSLLNSMYPPKSLASSLLMESPSPVPPNFLLVEPSACWKASKIKPCLSKGIPNPVSDTVNIRAFNALFFSSLSFTDPLAVNFIALESRFFKICSNRILSLLKIIGTSGSVSIKKSNFFSVATGLNKARIVVTISSVAISAFSNSILPASILERSKISSIKLNRP